YQLADDPGGDRRLPLHPSKPAAPHGCHVTLPLDIDAEVASALKAARPVVALESSVIAHGLKQPLNLDTATEVEAAIRQEGAVSATIAAFDGRIKVGLTAEQLAHLAQQPNVVKASRRDLAEVISRRQTAATTVAATMAIAHLAGIRVLATGGI